MPAFDGFDDVMQRLLGRPLAAESLAGIGSGTSGPWLRLVESHEEPATPTTQPPVPVPGQLRFWSFVPDGAGAGRLRWVAVAVTHDGAFGAAQAVWSQLPAELPPLVGGGPRAVIDPGQLRRRLAVEHEAARWLGERSDLVTAQAQAQALDPQFQGSTALAYLRGVEHTAAGGRGVREEQAGFEAAARGVLRAADGLQARIEATADSLAGPWGTPADGLRRVLDSTELVVAGRDHDGIDPGQVTGADLSAENLGATLRISSPYWPGVEPLDVFDPRTWPVVDRLTRQAWQRQVQELLAPLVESANRYDESLRAALGLPPEQGGPVGPPVGSTPKSGSLTGRPQAPGGAEAWGTPVPGEESVGSGRGPSESPGTTTGTTAGTTAGGPHRDGASSAAALGSSGAAVDVPPPVQSASPHGPGRVTGPGRAAGTELGAVGWGGAVPQVGGSGFGGSGFGGSDFGPRAGDAVGRPAGTRRQRDDDVARLEEGWSTSDGTSSEAGGATRNLLSTLGRDTSAGVDEDVLAVVGLPPAGTFSTTDALLDLAGLPAPPPPSVGDPGLAHVVSLPASDEGVVGGVQVGGALLPGDPTSPGPVRTFEDEPLTGAALGGASGASPTSESSSGATGMPVGAPMMPVGAGGGRRPGSVVRDREAWQLEPDGWVETAVGRRPAVVGRRADVPSGPPAVELEVAMPGERDLGPAAELVAVGRPVVDLQDEGGTSSGALENQGARPGPERRRP